MNEYQKAKQRYEECLEEMRKWSHDFSAEGQRAFLAAMEESRRAYNDLFWADQGVKAIPNPVWTLGDICSQ